MKLSEKIKLECFCAFIHSRIIGLDLEDEDDGVDVIKDEETIKELIEYKNLFISELEKIATLQTINKKIETSKSGLIAKQYMNNYKYLLKLIEKNIEIGQPYIPAFLGVCMLITYFEKDKNELKVSIKFDDLLKVSNHFETKSDDSKKNVLSMMKVAINITEKYWSN